MNMKIKVSPQTKVSKQFKLAELFCGPGGLALGCEGAKSENDDFVFTIKPAWANDIDQNTCDTYAKNIHSGNKSAVTCAPVQDIDFDKIKSFDALAFGFPCNDFSSVGEKLGFEGTFGPLYTYGVKAINAKNPKWFIAENVSGLQSANEGNAFKQILKDLADAGKGYNLTVHKYKFEEYGVPQARHRIVIVGIRKDLGLFFKVPAPTNKNNPITCKEAIESPPISGDATNNEISTPSDTVVERLKHIPPGKNAWYEGIPEHLRLNVKGAKMSMIYKRLDPSKPAYTLTGSGGGGTHVYHWKLNRALTNRERARLQTFPDWYDFVGSKESVRKQIGMAVPPTGAKHIAQAILKTFAGVNYKFVNANIDSVTGRLVKADS